MSAGRPNTETLEAPMLDIGIGDHETLKLCDNVIIFAVINNDQPNTGTAATSVSVTGVTDGLSKTSSLCESFQ